MPASITEESDMTEIKRKRGRPRKERITGTVTWAYKEKVSVPEFLRRLDNLLGSPINQMIECDGDLLMSEYQKLLQARYMLSNVVLEIETNG
jgi:hypothetical protein